MKFETPKNQNYVATVVRIKNTFPLENCDNLIGTSIFGFDVLLNKQTELFGIFFPAETQLSDEYCYNNNLYRHSNLNIDHDQKGYFEDNRRVRAIKFRGNKSNGIFMPLSSLSYTGYNIEDLREGDTFDMLNGKEVCRKYTLPVKEGRGQTVVDRGFVRADKRLFPEHIDTENFFRNADKIPKDSHVIITQKLHGTSIRIGNTLVNRKPTLIERIARFFGAKIAMTEYAELYGSRKVIKDANNPLQNHFYESDIWTLEGKKLAGIIPENYILYGELVGWTPDGAEIQKNYTYCIPRGQCELYIYRIAVVNGTGYMTDLSWGQVKEFCDKNGLKYTPEMYGAPVPIWVATENDCEVIRGLMDMRYADDYKQGFNQCIPLDENDTVDEGVCIRIEGLTPKIYKAKSPKFLEHETKLLDSMVEDLESSQSTTEENEVSK